MVLEVDRSTLGVSSGSPEPSQMRREHKHRERWQDALSAEINHILLRFGRLVHFATECRQRYCVEARWEDNFDKIFQRETPSGWTVG